jgi:2-isopropylmalate synthase
MTSKISKTAFSRPPAIENPNRQWPGKTIEKTPLWCAVDLRDGNQALPNPMTPEQKLRYFKLLCDIGFKEIEIGFPSASADDFQFTRDLIEKNLIPDDVTISVLLQARPEQVVRTVESLKGVKQAVIHYYIATSDLHREFVFGKTREEQLVMARETTTMIRDLAATEMKGSKVGLEFSPEEFTDSDLDYAIEICDTVVDSWNPQGDEKVILNLPATVERRLPNEYADMVEVFISRIKRREQCIISMHAHNDMGMAVSAMMMTLMAGADRIEGTLCGHGERTGNVDLITTALNLDYLGVNTGLNFDNLGDIVETVEEITDMPVHPRHPYAGQLVFTAFSGSHQDAIHKGFARQERIAPHFGSYKMPYLHVEPSVIGRNFEKFIRINSQSGKGGIAHVMEHEYHIAMPRWVQVDFAVKVQAFADDAQRELDSKELWTIFKYHYKKHGEPLELMKYWPRPHSEDPDIIEGETRVKFNGEDKTLYASGNGPISAFVHTIKNLEGIPDFSLTDYAEGTRGSTADAEGICFINLKLEESGESHIGVGLGSNIDQAAARATIAALNGLLRDED